MSKSRCEVNKFFHGQVDKGTGTSADYVVAHAARQKQRGKKPSVNYRGYTNPRDSLAAAQADIEARDGEGRYAAFSGRVVIMRVWSERQRDVAEQYLDDRIESDHAVGAVIREVEDGEVLQAPLHFRLTSQGTVETLLPI